MVLRSPRSGVAGQAAQTQLVGVWTFSIFIMELPRGGFKTIQAESILSVTNPRYKAVEADEDGGALGCV